MSQHEGPTVGIIGAGATGAYLAARLQESGERVTLVARGTTLDVIRADGIRIDDLNGDSRVVAPVHVVASTEIKEPVDLVFVCVKTYETSSIRSILDSLVGPSSHVVCLQNGVKGEGLLADTVGVERVISGVLYIGARRVSPGVVACSAPPRVIVGPFTESADAAAHAVKDLFDRCGITCRYDPTVQQAKWEKFLFNCGLNPLTAITGTTLGPLLKNQDVRPVFDALVDEAADVARARGITLASGFRTRVGETAARMDISSSMAEDLAAGRSIELDAFSGYVLDMASEYQVAVPVTRVIHALMTALVEARQRG